MLNIIGGILQLILLVLSKWFEKDAEKKKAKAGLQKELSDAITAKDTSGITSVLDRVNRL